MPGLRIACAQINCVVGDIAGNVERVLAAYEAAADEVCDVVLFPELTLTGYPPEDLLLKQAFVAEAEASLDKLASRIGETVAIVGLPIADDGLLYNAAAVLGRGEVIGLYYKQILPNYQVFDEERYFDPGGDEALVFGIGKSKIGVSICEDVWSTDGPPADQVEIGAQVVLNINASPYFRDRIHDRERMLRERVGEIGVPIVYCNMVGGQDELVFDGGSMVIDEQGGLVARAKQFEEDLLVVDLDDLDGSRVEPLLDGAAEVYGALVLGTGDYVRKTGFTDVAIGLSGGIDSSLVAAIAVDALGAEHVHGVLMPSRYSSDHSVTDAEQLAANLGIKTYTVPIEPAHAAFESMLADTFAGTKANLAEENMQARIRGNVMMTISNKFNWMVLTTGNKSEMATGYATLYGDMAGGYAVIKDVPKTLVYDVAHEINRAAGTDRIPLSVIEKPPSAELAPGQLDSDSLPPYDVLDPIIEGYVDDDLSVNELVQHGFDEATVRRIARLVDRNEYKRRQAPPGVRVSSKAFGKDRRLPITNHWPG
ncbi:MAG TPA: NAD+ synthase [Acidimicrobiia bacterium]|jgi:NAD+ synthase (glutamine-hydrolysing)